MEERRNPADANRNTRDYYDSLWIEQRLIGSGIASLEMELFGKTFRSPVMMSALSHIGVLGEGRKTGMEEYAEVAARRRMVNWIGYLDEDAAKKIFAQAPDTIHIIKPYADRERFYREMQNAEACGALAVGTDIDHIFGESGAYDYLDGPWMTGQSVEDLKAYVAATKLPFVVKGVLSVRDAVLCAQAGVRGIVLSHHHGRLPYAVPPVMLLPQIKEALKGTGIKIFVDCHVDRGADAFKALALGADAVSVGRISIPVLKEEGVEGLVRFFDRFDAELKYIMNFTGSKDIRSIDPTVLHRRP